jgi:cyclic-di-GMP phosphodiesterase TipF (flagellum assembly factor)
MVTTQQVRQDQKPILFILTPALLAASLVAVVPVECGLVMPVLAFLSMAAFSGLLLLWRQAERDRILLAGRLTRLEQQMQALAANPALRSSVADVTGRVGVLGGVVRELAKTMAVQNRDVADLKDTLKAASEPCEERPVEKPSLRLAPEGRPVKDRIPEPSLLPSMRRPSPEEVSRMRLVTQAFEADRIELHLQPVVSLPQRKIRFYEALARLRLADGTLLGPSEFLPLLECLGRAPDFDRRVLSRAMAIARHLVARGSEAIVTVNLSAHSVAEPGFLWSLIGPMDAAADILGRIVLELPQHSWRHLDADQRTALASLRDRGVPLSLDRAGDLRFDPRALADLGIRFMRLPAELMVAAAQQDDGRQAGPELHVRDFASVLRRQGIRLIAERVDQEEMVPVLADLGVPLAQGFVFSPPRPIKAEVLGEQAPAHEADEAPAPMLLRRAG